MRAPASTGPRDHVVYGYSCQWRTRFVEGPPSRSDRAVATLPARGLRGLDFTATGLSPARSTHLTWTHS